MGTSGGTRRRDRRAPDPLAPGRAIVRIVVGAQNRVKFMRVHDESRLLPGLAANLVTGKELIPALPEAQQDGLYTLLANVRREQRPVTWQFPSQFHDGEMRVMVGQPVRDHLGWVALSVYYMDRLLELPPDSTEADRPTDRPSTDRATSS